MPAAKEFVDNLEAAAPSSGSAVPQSGQFDPSLYTASSMRFFGGPIQSNTSERQTLPGASNPERSSRNKPRTVVQMNTTERCYYQAVATWFMQMQVGKTDPARPRDSAPASERLTELEEYIMHNGIPTVETAMIIIGVELPTSSRLACARPRRLHEGQGASRSQSNVAGRGQSTNKETTVPPAASNHVNGGSLSNGADQVNGANLPNGMDHVNGAEQVNGATYVNGGTH